MSEDLEDVDIGKRIRRAFQGYLDKGAKELEGNLAEESPIDHGKLRDSWHTQRDGKNARNVGSTAGYAFVVSEGSDPYTIRAKNEPFLHFKVDGQWVRTKEVQHPGIEGSGYIDDAIQDTMSRLETLAMRALDEAGV